MSMILYAWAQEDEMSSAQSWSTPIPVTLGDWHCYECDKHVKAGQHCSGCNAAQSYKQQLRPWPFPDGTEKALYSPCWSTLVIHESEDSGQEDVVWECRKCGALVENSKTCSECNTQGPPQQQLPLWPFASGTAKWHACDDWNQEDNMFEEEWCWRTFGQSRSMAVRTTLALWYCETCKTKVSGLNCSGCNGAAPPPGHQLDSKHFINKPEELFGL
jgi:hypothetical protein